MEKPMDKFEERVIGLLVRLLEDQNGVKIEYTVKDKETDKDKTA